MTRHRRKLQLWGIVLSGVLSWSELGYGGGPEFPNNYVRVEGVAPRTILKKNNDTLDWKTTVNGEVVDAFAIEWQEDNSVAFPLVIEKGAPTNTVYVDAQGHIGLGTATPQNSLHITDSGPAIRFEDNDTLPQQWLIGGDPVKFVFSDVTHGLTPLVIQAGTLGTNNNVETGGNIGIGTEVPSEAVDVVRRRRASRFQLTSLSDNASDAAQFIQRRSRLATGGVTPTGVQSGDNLGLFSFRGMRPNGQFSGSQATITVQTTQDWTNTAHGTRMLFGTTPNGTSSVQTVMEITHDGRVLINGSQLEVPDYVFAADYELMPLDELQAYIDEHQHLPEVASEAEVKAGGVDLTGTQMALLKKIEELTLYTLQQHEQLAKQAEQLITLAQRNAHLSDHNASLTQQNAALVRKDAELEQRLAALEQQHR